MSYQEAIDAVAADALLMVRDGQTLGLGSGRAATALVRRLGHLAKETTVWGVPTSLQIRAEAEEAGILLLELGQVSNIDIMFDGADQIDRNGYLVKGGGGAHLRERIVAGMANKVVIMADQTKFVDAISMPIPLEIHPAARSSVLTQIGKMGGRSKLRILDRGYPVFTENGNIILDCAFGRINDPLNLVSELRQIPGIMEVGLFEKPNIIYKAQENGRFEKITPRHGD